MHSCSNNTPVMRPYLLILNWARCVVSLDPIMLFRFIQSKAFSRTKPSFHHLSLVAGLSLRVVLAQRYFVSVVNGL